MYFFNFLITDSCEAKQASKPFSALLQLSIGLQASSGYAGSRRTGMLSLSNSCRLRMKSESPSSFLAVSQSGFSWRRMHTASMVCCRRRAGQGGEQEWAVWAAETAVGSVRH